MTDFLTAGQSVEVSVYTGLTFVSQTNRICLFRFKKHKHTDLLFLLILSDKCFETI